MITMQGDYGSALRRLRVANGLTLKEVEHRSGVSWSMVATIERGGNTTVETLDKVARTIGGEAFATVVSGTEQALIVAPEIASLLQALQEVGPDQRQLLWNLASVLDELRPEVRAMLAALVDSHQAAAAGKAAGGG
jgi:transcriptional regulator with XRE-family HTH domain